MRFLRQLEQELADLIIVVKVLRARAQGQAKRDILKKTDKAMKLAKKSDPLNKVVWEYLRQGPKSVQEIRDYLLTLDLVKTSQQISNTLNSLKVNKMVKRTKNGWILK